MLLSGKHFLMQTQIKNDLPFILKTLHFLSLNIWWAFSALFWIKFRFMWFANHRVLFLIIFYCFGTGECTIFDKLHVSTVSARSICCLQVILSSMIKECEIKVENRGMSDAQGWELSLNHSHTFHDNICKIVFFIIIIIIIAWDSD